MTYEIQASREFERDFKKLDSFLQERIRRKFKKVALCPERYKHLRGKLTGNCRIWIDKLRIIFSYSSDRRIIFLKNIVFKHKY